MFKSTVGGTKVKGGFYFNRNEWEMTVVNGKEGTLPGGPDTHFVRIPVLLMLVGAPVMGGLLVMFLPLIGIVMLLGHAARKVSRYVRRLAAADLSLPIEATVEPLPTARHSAELQVLRPLESNKPPREV